MPVRVGTLNCNGLRAAHRKGLELVLQRANCDIIFLQEIRTQIGFDHKPFLPKNYHIIANPAQKPGYSGTLMACKLPLGSAQPEFSWPQLPLCEEGRLIDFSITPNLRLINFYWPSGGEESRQILKINFLKSLPSMLLNTPGICLIGGDFNIAPTDQDLKNWRGNKEQPGCTTEERLLLKNWINSSKLKDVYRVLHPADKPELYSWWSYRQKAFDRNVGWRIDTFLISQSHSSLCLNHGFISEPRCSDHALYWIDLNL